MARSCLPGGRLPADAVLLIVGAYGKAVFPGPSSSPALLRARQPQCRALGGIAYSIEIRGVDFLGCVGGPTGAASLRSVIATIR